MINETTGQLASHLEVLGTHADLGIRRSMPMPPDITARFDTQLETDQQLDWAAPLSGAIVI